jgi:hypothetical protein
MVELQHEAAVGVGKGSRFLDKRESCADRLTDRFVILSRILRD